MRHVQECTLPDKRIEDELFWNPSPTLTVQTSDYHVEAVSFGAHAMSDAVLPTKNATFDRIGRAKKIARVIGERISQVGLYLPE